jgi:hypothetical protein
LHTGSGAYYVTSFQYGLQALDQGGRTDGQTPAVHVAIATDYARLGGSTANGVYIGNAQPALHLDSQQPALSVSNAGGGAALSLMQPSIVLGFIIRYA